MGRVELSGPRRRLTRVNAGIDVHGDGSIQAYVGRLQRKALALRPDEDATAALRRALVPG